MFSSSTLATEEINTAEVVEELEQIAEQTEVLEIKKDDPVVKKFEEYAKEKGENFENTEEVYVGVKSNEILTVQFNIPVVDLDLTTYEVKYNITTDEFFSVLKIQKDGSTNDTKITDLETGEIEIMEQICDDCGDEQFNEIQSEIEGLEEVTELQEQVDTIIDEQSSELQAQSYCPRGTTPMTKCKNKTAFSVSKYLACFYVGIIQRSKLYEVFL